MSNEKTRKVGRDASTGEFISVKAAKERPKTTTVETVPIRISKARSLKRKDYSR